jgi:hypothetical protein
MKYKLLLLLCIANFSYCAAQSKEELIDAIVKHNVYETNLPYSSTSPTNPKQLSNIFSDEELKQLLNHKNGVLRMYVSTYLIEQNLADPAALLSNELNQNETVKTLNGCLGGNDPTPNIIYFSYRNKIWAEASKGINYELNDLIEEAVNRRLKTDPKMKEMDSIVISTDLKPSYYLYRTSFENNNFSPALLPTVEKLGFQKNNPYAIGYLTDAYPELYKERALKYYADQFPKLTFPEDDRNSIMYFHEFLELLLKTGDKKIQQIAIDSFKKSEYIEKEWFKNTFKEYNIEI